MIQKNVGDYIGMISQSSLSTLAALLFRHCRFDFVKPAKFSMPRVHLSMKPCFPLGFTLRFLRHSQGLLFPVPFGLPLGRFGAVSGPVLLLVNRMLNLVQQKSINLLNLLKK